MGGGGAGVTCWAFRTDTDSLGTGDAASKLFHARNPPPPPWRARLWLGIRVSCLACALKLHLFPLSHSSWLLLPAATPSDSQLAEGRERVCLGGGGVQGGSTDVCREQVGVQAGAQEWVGVGWAPCFQRSSIVRRVLWLSGPSFAHWSLQGNYPNHGHLPTAL